MPLYFGKSEDGSDIQEFKGFPTSSCGRYFSSEPFTPQSEKRLKDHLRRSEWKKKIHGLMKLT